MRNRPGRPVRARLVLVALLVALGGAGCAETTAGSPQAATVPLSTGGPAATVSIPPLTGGSESAPTTIVPESTTATRTAPAPTSRPTPATTSGPSTHSTHVWQLPAFADRSERTEFGDVIAEPGDVNAIRLSEDDVTKDVVAFRVRSVKLDGPCAEPAEPENGHFLVLTLDVELGDITPEELHDGFIGFGRHDWQAWTTDGEPQSAISSDAALTCEGDQGIPLTADLDPDRVNTGLVVLDVTEPTGTVVFNPNLDHGWEYGYP